MAMTNCRKKPRIRIMEMTIFFFGTRHDVELLKWL
jgi:hypothetical protein